MTNADRAYVDGFNTRCVEHGVSPDALIKAAQASPTVGDLFNAINSDMSLDIFTRNRLVAQARAAASGIPVSAPASRIVATGAGAALGYLISKYFGGSLFGRTVSTVAGGAIGNWADKSIFHRDDPSRRNGAQFRGYRMI